MSANSSSHLAVVANINRPFHKPSAASVWLRWAIFVLVLMGLGLAIAQGLVWIERLLAAYNGEPGVQVMSPTIITLMILYAILIAIPFMPGIEVGLALLLMEGAAVAPFVYLATVVGLMFAFLIGHLMPLSWLYSGFQWLGLERACKLIDSIAHQTPEQRLAKQREVLPNALAKLTVDFRYLTIGILLNVPGTVAIGGGGGILLAAGLSRVFHPVWVLVTLMLATLPVPLAVWIMGTHILT